MKKSLAAISFLAVFAATSTASAADLDRELGLIVSGVVDKWAGVQFIDDGLNDETVFANGGEGRLSLPLGENLSVQSDVKYEYNSNALESPFNNGVFGPRYSFQGTGHLSYRDPSSFLIGAFGGAGGTSGFAARYDVSYFGGEAQFYADNFTLYAQGGFVDFDLRSAVMSVPLDNGYFARGVVRWFPTADSRLQLEGTYLNADYAFINAEMEAFSVKARYDFNFNLPIAGETPLFVAYRGTFRDTCSNVGNDVDDHTFMVGTSYSFSGDMLTVDRQGATLDTPDFNYACAVPTGQGSDRRLKTDIAELGETENGTKLYSWKYKNDPVTTWVGVMAQDLVSSHPEALVTGADGFYKVRYDLLDVNMMTLEQWNSRQL